MHSDLVSQGLGAHRPGIAEDLLRVELVLDEVAAPAAVGIAVLVRGKEGKDERKVYSPGSAPHFHHGFLELVITFLADIGASLIPDDALCSITGDGSHAPVPDEFRSLGPAVRLLLDCIDCIQFLLGKTRIVYYILRHPGLYAAAAPGIYDNAHRYAQALCEPLRKEITHCRCPRNHIGRRERPCSLDIIDGLGFLRSLYIENTHVLCRFHGIHDGIRGTFHFLEAEAAYGHLHVGLAAAEPYFAQHHVRNGNLVLSGNHVHGIRTARLTGGDGNPPRAVFLNGCLVRAVVPGRAHTHCLSRLSPAPYIHIGLPLKHHVVRENMSYFECLCTEKCRD